MKYIVTWRTTIDAESALDAAESADPVRRAEQDPTYEVTGQDGGCYRVHTGSGTVQRLQPRPWDRP